MSELPLGNHPRWTVRTKYRHQTRAEIAAHEEPEITGYHLCFGNNVELRRKGEAGFHSLVDMASFLNRRKLTPRDRIECAADAPNPEAYLKKISH